MTEIKKSGSLRASKNHLQVRASFNCYNAATFEIRCTQTNKQTNRPTNNY